MIDTPPRETQHPLEVEIRRNWLDGMGIDERAEKSIIEQLTRPIVRGIR